MNVFIEKKISIKPGFTVEIELITHFDIINKLFLQVQRDESGKRYGNPVLDFIRELNRYINVNHCDGITSIVDIDVKPDDNQKHDKYDLLKMLFQKEFFSTLKNENKSYKSISKKINHITKAKESKK